ncbi:MAG: class I SAM-dependent methyltransferase [Nonlabens sp.]
MKYNNILLLLALILLSSCKGQTPKGVEKAVEKKQTESNYVFKDGSYNGIGKWYMGREIAHVMGFQGMEWLERPEREKEENVSKLLKNMNIQPTDNIADIGAGSGYHVFKMVQQLDEGTIYAVDIQSEMLDAMRVKKETKKIESIQLIKGDEQSTNLPANSVDKILMVDVYHEFNYPVEMIASMKKALKENGEIYLIEYRLEDPNIPIKTIHKMSEAQAVKEFESNGFQLKENIDNLPWQHCMVFEKMP